MKERRQKRGENWHKMSFMYKVLFFFFKLKNNWVLSEINNLEILISILSFFVFSEAYPFPFFLRWMILMNHRTAKSKKYHGDNKLITKYGQV